MNTKLFRIIAISSLWIVVSEFLRNEILFKSYWVSHYDSLGLSFRTLPVHGLLWTVWSLLLATQIHVLLQKFASSMVFMLTWIVNFAMMWLVLYNLQVLPLNLLIFAIPLSGLEIYVAICIQQKLS